MRTSLCIIILLLVLSPVAQCTKVRDVMKPLVDCRTHIEIKNDMNTASLVDPEFPLGDGIMETNPKYSILPGDKDKIVIRGDKLVSTRSRGTLVYKIEHTNLQLVVSWNVPAIWEYESTNQYGIYIYEDPSPETIRSTPLHPAEGKYREVRNKNIIVKGVMSKKHDPEINIIVTDITNYRILGTWSQIIITIITVMIIMVIITRRRRRQPNNMMYYSVP